MSYYSAADWLQTASDAAQRLALTHFDGVATMGAAADIRAVRECLCADMLADLATRRESNALLNPFRDAEAYVLPLLVAAAAWVLAQLVDASCSTDFCESTEATFKRIYTFILVCLLAATYRCTSHCNLLHY